MQTKLESNCLHGLEICMNANNSNGIEEVTQYYLSPRNMQEPVWTMWMTTVIAAIMVVDNWSQICATLVAIKHSKKRSSHLAKAVVDALSLLKSKAVVLEDSHGHNPSV